MTPEAVARALLQSYERLDAEQIADVLWLLASNSADTAARAVPSKDPVGDTPRSPPDVSAPVVQGVEPAEAARSTPSEIPAYLPGSAEKGITAARKIALPGPGALGHALEFTRSLKPFKRRHAAYHRREINLDATIFATAEAGRLVLVSAPGTERWFDLVLVADASSSMLVWRDTINDVERLMQQSGVFRSVSRWDLLSDAGGMTVRDATGSMHGSARFVDPAGRRVVVVVTDGVDRVWYQRPVWLTLEQWGSAMPTVILQILSPPYWPDTGIGEPSLMMRASAPGTANRQSVVRRAWWCEPDSVLDGPRETGPVAVPLMSLTAEGLGSWAEAVTSASRWLEGVSSRTPRAEPAIDDSNISAAQRVQSFLARSSVGAQRLAHVLAAAPHLSLPLIRLLQHRLAPGTGVTELAEVFVNGLISEERSGSERFAFRSGVRELLRRGMTAFDEWDLYLTATEHLSGSFGESSTQMLHALVVDPDGLEQLSDVDRPFGSLIGDLSRRLGLHTPANGIAPGETDTTDVAFDDSRQESDAATQRAQPAGRLTEQEFVAHLYAPVDGPNAALASRQLARIWRRCRSELAMTEPISRSLATEPTATWPTELPTEWPSVGEFTVVAALQDLGADRQVILRREHDVLNLSLVFAAPIGGERVLRLGTAVPPGWVDFARWWEQLTIGGTGALLGTALIFQAKAPSEDTDLLQYADDVRNALPPDPEDETAWWTDGRRTDEGFGLWEVTTPSDGPARRLVVLANPGQDTTLSDLTWSDGSVALPPLGRYLMHAAKLRYQSRIRGDGARLRALRDEIGHRLDRTPPPVEELTEDELTLAATLATLRNLGRTAEIAVANMEGSFSPALDGDLVGMTLLQRVPDDIAYLESLDNRLRTVLRVHEERRPPRGGSGSSVLVPPEPEPEPEPKQDVPDQLDLAMCFSVDIVAYSSRSGPAQAQIQKRLAAIVRRTLAHLGLNALPWQTLGDGMKVVFPVTTQLHHALPGLLDALCRELAADNKQYQDRLRLRFATSVGMIGPDEIGYTGELAVEVHRLLESNPLRQAVLDNPHADLVALVSDTLHRFVLEPDWARLPPGSLEAQQIQTKGYERTAWLWVPQPPAP